MSGIVIVMAIQSTFHLEIHQIKFFYFFEIVLTSAYQNNMKIYKKIILNKKNLKFKKTWFVLYFQTKSYNIS